MRKTFLTIVLIVAGIYFLLHLILGSSPVQKWVLGQLTDTLSRYGIVLKIDSIEFSAFSPKLYLNRVSLSTTRKAIVYLENPLLIDKIKIQFNPIALLYKRIVIEEVALFHPQIFLPRADVLYRKVKYLLEKNRQVELKGEGAFSVVVRKMGVVDALFDIKSEDPPFMVRSRSLSAFLESGTGGQRLFSLQSPNLELQRGKLSLNFTKVDVDLDGTKNSIRVNRAIVTGDNLSVDIKGTSSLPLSMEKAPELLRLSYEFSLPLTLLNQVKELKVPVLEGQLESSGTINVARGVYGGKGEVKYHGVLIDGYRIGNGAVTYGLDRNDLLLSRLTLGFGRGELTSQNLRIELKDRIPISGDVEIRSLPLQGLLESLKEPSSVVRSQLRGALKVSGALRGPMEIKGALQAAFSGLTVVNHADGEAKGKNLLMDFSDGTASGQLTFTDERFIFDADIGVLGAKGKARGYVGYDNLAELRVELEHFSFDKLGHISTLTLGGQANLIAEVKVDGRDAKVAGMFDFSNAQIAGVLLGDVKGQAYFQNLLLSFENLEMPSVEPVRGHGFVDFGKPDIHYRFEVEVGRSPLDQVFGIFQKFKLGFTIPTGGEVSGGARIEGGHDSRGIEVSASGRARGIEWYAENWNTTHFNFIYRPDVIELARVMLLKESGALEVSGQIREEDVRLHFKSHGLDLADLDHIRGTPLTAKIEGELTVEGNRSGLLSSGSGQVSLVNTRYRGEQLADSVVNIRPQKKGMEFLGTIMGEAARGRYVRHQEGPMRDELLLYFNKLDLMPLISLLLKKDISTVSSIQATGDFSLKGKFSDWKTVSGSGLISEVEVGLRGTPLRNTGPVAFTLGRGRFEISRFNLVGVDGEAVGEFRFIGENALSGSLDAKLDLKYLQPFIPILDYASGKANIALRLSGPPDQYRLLGSASLDGGVVKFTGLKDEFRATQLQISLSQDAVTIDRFESNVNGGTLTVSGNIRINRFTRFSPNLRLTANRVQMKLTDSLTAMLSGQFELSGQALPYLLKGRCTLIEGKMTSFEMQKVSQFQDARTPALTFDVACECKGGFQVQTDVMNAEWKGDFNLRGDTNRIGILGKAEVAKGSLLFRKTRFDIESGNVRFESAETVRPRFRLAGTASVTEQQAVVTQEYQVNIQVFGTPDDYKIRLSSSPSLSEGDIISLLVLGVTTQVQDGTGSYLQLGTALAGQLPLQTKIQDQFGFDINVKTQELRAQDTGTTVGTGTALSSENSVASVQIQKRLTDKTRVSFSNTLETVPAREFKIEQMLDDNLTVNATAGVGTPGSVQNELRQSYGVDFRYRFQFE